MKNQPSNPSAPHVILVGTYRREQLEKWILPKGLYNYPILESDEIPADRLPAVKELWLFNGTKNQMFFDAEFLGILDRAQLVDYPKGRGKPHGNRYLLFKVVQKYGPDLSDAPVIVRADDFAGRSPAIRRQIMEALSSSDAAKRATVANRLPSAIAALPPERLCVCEEALQLDFWECLYADTGDTMRQVCQCVGCVPNTPGWPDVFGARIKALHAARGNRPIRTLSLFSGAGGLDIGFSDVGFEIVESVEIEDKFCETLELNSGPGKRFAGSKVNCIDIRKYTASHLGSIDFVIGGPPCQTFSAAGRRANGVLGTTDARGVLFREYVRLLKELSPQGFLFENVYGITGAQNGTAWREIQESFREAGYHLFYRILDAADYGVPQHRERLIIVGLKSGEFRFPRPSHGPDSLASMPFYTAGTAVQGVPLTPEEAKPGLGGRFGHLLPDIPPGLNYSFYTEKLGHPKPVFAWRSKFSDFLYKADPDAPVRTIKASGGAYTGPLHWANRFFSVSEYKRLQTFPDDYELSGGKQVAVKQIGNSVPPQLARMLALSIQIQVFGADYPFTLPLLDPGEALTFRQRKADLTREYQSKAAKAIARAAKGSVQTPAQTSYDCSLSSDFEFRKEADGCGEFRVSFRPDVGLAVRESSSKRPRSPGVCARIHVKPRGGDWALGLDDLEIDVFSRKPKAFTVGWKAFEQLLVDGGGQADLVQLNGYYQYEPKLACSCEFFGDFPFHAVIASVVAGRDVARIVGTAQLALDWGIEEPEVWTAAEFLRSIGYEIRNTNTNPQIPPGHWLIPYAFPTFTQRSVQLRKKLR